MKTRVSVMCPSCSSQFKARITAVGKKIKCPQCGVSCPVFDPDEATPSTTPCPCCEAILPKATLRTASMGKACPACSAPLNVFHSTADAGDATLQVESLFCEKCYGHYKFKIVGFNIVGLFIPTVSVFGREVICSQCAHKPSRWMGQENDQHTWEHWEFDGYREMMSTLCSLWTSMKASGKLPQRQLVEQPV